MHKIRVQLWEPHRATHGNRIPIHEEPHVTLTKGKIKSRLRDKRKKIETDQMADSEKKASNVKVSKANWLGRRERGNAY